MNTNEIQIRLTADIQALQSALAKAQKTLQDFEAKNSAETEKSNKAKERQLGIIEKLNTQAKKLQVSIKQATSKDDIAKFNQELEKTKKQLSFLNNLGKGPSSPVGLINNLNAKIKILKQSIAEATNEKSVARLNAELERTQQELKRIESLGKAVTTPAVRSFDNLKRSAGAATGSAIAFSRIIQDAPFGIIGVANNLQSFGEQFAALGGKATTAGQRLSMFFSALITPANLAILAVSALTAAWQAYSLGLFDSEEETKDLNKELEDFKNNLDGLSKAQLEGAQSAQSEIQAFKLLKLQAENANIPLEKRILAVEELRNQFPDYFKGLSDEEILLGRVGDAYDKLTKSITAQATAKSLSKRIDENATKSLALLLQEEQRAQEILTKRDELEKLIAQRQAAEQGGQFVAGQTVAISNDILEKQKEINDLIQQTVDSAEERRKIALETLSIESKIPAEIEKAGGLIQENNKSLDDSKKKVEFYDQAWNENEKSLIRIFQLLNAIKDETPDEGLAPKGFKPEEEPADVVPKGRIEFLEEQIALFEFLRRLQTDTTKIDEYNLKIAQLREELDLLNGKKVDENLNLIVDAFSSLGAGIAASLNIGDRALRGFVTTLLSATPKIIAAILAQASARRQAAAAANAANAQQATGNAIVVATEGAKGLGPVGLALLPVFIAGAVALISAAFSKAGSGGGSPSVGTGTTFTNRREFGGPVSKGRAYIVGERRPELFVPNTNGIIIPQLPSMDYSGASMAAGAMAVDVNIRGVSYGDDILFTVQQAQIRRGLR